MPAGVSYNLNAEPVIEELCRFETVFRHSGGFNLDDSSLTDGYIVPVLAPIAVDFTTRKVKVVKNATIVEAANASATSYKIAKNSLIAVGMYLGTGAKGAEVTAIDKTNASYDLVTVAATIGAAVTVGQVLFEATAVGGTTPKNVANKLNYAITKVESGETVTAVGRAYEVIESKLKLPISDKDKASLGDNFMFQP
ncbi:MULTISPECIES: head fiber protein [Dysgonomonas]|uniref:head fiber protein n=1 Tax=Dysgonomonas TaxID=156973 RepID=UPI00092AB32C|nr:MULTISPECIES: head fiber protein [Dysgonomonas]MBN9300295.1 hypothetical protein [Dysgonomonas mossii]OJX63105.1 MAG: hypothetical protein BGO84_14470 [Dysgonomonas sp. 37-18]